MNQPISRTHAVVVLPAATPALFDLSEFHRRLSRGGLSYVRPVDELLNRTLQAIGRPALTQGLAALRLWGQTGDRPDVWVSAADPVYLEPMLDHLRLHAFANDELPLPQLREVIDTLQSTVGADGRYSFVNVGQYAYLCGDPNIATANRSAEMLHGRRPDDDMPQGADAVAFDALQSELQMELHEHAVNLEREAAGLPLLNSLWFWGGGFAPAQETINIPRLYSDDPLFRGYWRSCSAELQHWPGRIGRCLEEGDGEFVAVTPEIRPNDEQEFLRSTLNELVTLMRSGRLSRITLLFRDGLEARLARWDNLKFWRSVSPLLRGTS